MSEQAEVTGPLPVVSWLKLPEDGDPYLEGHKCSECGAVYLGTREVDETGVEQAHRGGGVGTKNRRRCFGNSGPGGCRDETQNQKGRCHTAGELDAHIFLVTQTRVLCLTRIVNSKAHQLLPR